MDELNRMLRITRNLLVMLTILSAGVILGLLLSGLGPQGGGDPVMPPAQAAVGIPVAAPMPGPLVESPFVAVARRVVPAVVFVDASLRVKHPPIEDGSPADILRKLMPGSPGGTDDEAPDEIDMPSSGSGFIIDAAGYILTNNHMVENSNAITVHLADGRTYPADLVGTDPKTDVAVLRIHPQAGDPELPTVVLGNSDSVEVGEWAMAIGNPMGELQGSVTVGVISAKSRSDLPIVGGGPDYQDFIQTDASINFGNSGGPLVNTRGEVIGMNAAVNPTGQGLGFAIPINMAEIVGRQLIATGHVARAFLGIVPQQLTPELAEGLGLGNVRGILVASVDGNTPAEQAGLRQKDVILSLNGRPVTEVNPFRRRVAEEKIGSEVVLDVLRQGRRMEIRVRLAARPDEVAQRGVPAVPPAEPERPTEWLGARLEPLSRADAEDLGIPWAPAVIVTGVKAGSITDEAGLQEGDLVQEVNDRPVRNLGEWGAALEAAGRTDRPVVLRISRGGVVSFLAVRLPKR